MYASVSFNYCLLLPYIASFFICETALSLPTKLFLPLLHSKVKLNRMQNLFSGLHNKIDIFLSIEMSKIDSKKHESKARIGTQCYMLQEIQIFAIFINVNDNIKY